MGNISVQILLLVCILQINLNGIEAKSIDKDLTMSWEQKVILDKFRKRVLSKLPHEYMTKDLYLIRWLRARRFNIFDAEEMLMNNLRWRAENNIDHIHEENWSEFTRDYPFYLDGRDKEGKPILYFNIGDMDVRKGVLSGNSGRLIRYMEKAIDQTINLIRDLSEKHKNVTQGILMINLQNYNVLEHGCAQCIPIILRGIVLTYENYYVGNGEKIILLNTPSIFEPLLNAIRLLLSPPTNEALKIYSTNRREWKAALSRDFDWSELPPEIGGSKIYSGMDDY